MQTHRFAHALACPTCRTMLDAAIASATHRTAPVAGDVTVCGHCAAMLELVPGPALARLTPAAVNALPLRLRAELLARSAVAAWLGPRAFSASARG